MRMRLRARTRSSDGASQLLLILFVAFHANLSVLLLKNILAISLQIAKKWLEI
jgi:hypothetical protein